MAWASRSGLSVGGALTGEMNSIPESSDSSPPSSGAKKRFGGAGAGAGSSSGDSARKSGWVAIARERANDEVVWAQETHASGFAA